jgi:hypothetical protein
VIRAALPPDRIRAAIPIPVLGGSEADSLAARDLATLHERALARARARDDGSVLNVALRPFSPGYDYGDPSARVAPGVLVTAASESGTAAPRPNPVAVAVNPLVPSSASGIALASVALVALAGAVGYGWARGAIGRGMNALALAPAFGLGAITLSGVALDRVGIRLDGSLAPTVAVALAGAGGYAVLFVLQRRAVAKPAPKVVQQPEQ